MMDVMDVRSDILRAGTQTVDLKHKMSSGYYLILYYYYYYKI